MTDSVTLGALVDDAIFASVEHQFHLAATLGNDHRFDLAIADGRITLSSSPQLTSPIQLLGSAAPAPNTWLWGWANQASDLPASILQSAEQVRQVGIRYGIAELTQAEIALVPRLTQALTVASKAVTRQYYHYSCPTPGGTRVQVLLTGLGLELPPPSAVRALQVIPQGLSEVGITDSRRALRSFAALRGLGIREDATQVHLLCPDGAVVCRLDQWGRIASISLGQA